MEVLSLRGLNRALLARQMLLERRETSALSVVDHLVGLNAQDPDPPYIGLWSRITGFETDDLTRLLYERTVVRGSLYRGTQHMVTADDYLWLRPLLHPMLVRLQKNAFKTTDGIALDELVGTARTLLGQGELTRPELGRTLAERWPDGDPVELARSIQFLTAVVHPPPDGTWAWRSKTPFVLAEQWLGRPLADEPSAARLILRHLAAFGPATVRDVQAWSGLTRLREVMEELRPGLRVFRNESGRELFDLPDAPRPGPDVEAPVRFLAALDNVLLGHHDRSRVVNDEQRKHVFLEAAMTVDGFVRGLWRIRRDKGRATVVVRLFEPLSGQDRDAVTEEGLRLLRFAARESGEHDLVFQPIDAPWPDKTPWNCSYRPPVAS
ncbi:winged helix DNA-binding domain-containing protein [Nonomuraea sp. NPDC046570]|uniref:winged helix DNA-binding domain-containing protein n=1 Tax=Nonomuraea sp. NPDC046570 TaxID=3155255 RepID=UPI0033C0CC9D